MPSRRIFADQRPRSSRLPGSSPVATVTARLREHRVRGETRARRPGSPSRTPVLAPSAPPLEDFILKGGDPQGASLGGRARLGDVHATHGRRHVRAGFGEVEEVLEVGLQVILCAERNATFRVREIVIDL